MEGYNQPQWSLRPPSGQQNLDGLGFQSSGAQPQPISFTTSPQLTGLDGTAFDFASSSRSIPNNLSSGRRGSDLQRIRSDSSIHRPSTSADRRSNADGDDLFSQAVGPVETTSSRMQDVDVHHHLAQASSTQPPDPTATPSRTLLVRNVAADADDDELSSIFKSFGDVRNLYLDSKVNNGLVIVSYFDLRAAVSAKNTLHGTLVNNLPLEIHYSKQKSGTQDPYGLSELQGTIVVYNLDPETTNEHMGFMFSKFGDIKDVSQSADRSSQTLVTFYDVRHAAAALKAMNRAEHLGKLPSHITPQQAASMAYITGSSPSLMQLAALQLQHDGQGGPQGGPHGQVGMQLQPGQWELGGGAPGAVFSQQARGPTGVPGGAALSEMQLHVSDSASSIASVAAAQQHQQQQAGFFGPGGVGTSSLGKGLAASMAAAAAAAMAGHGASGSGHGSSSHMGPGSSAAGGSGLGLGAAGSAHGSSGHMAGATGGGPSSSGYPSTPPSGAIAGLDDNMQSLLLQSGLSAVDAANMLMSLGLGPSGQIEPHQQQQQQLGTHHQMRQGPPGSTQGMPMWPPSSTGGMGGYGQGPQGPQGGGAAGSSAAVMAALQEMQSMQLRQQQQQQQIAAAQAQAHMASQIANLQQAQQALAAAGMSGGHGAAGLHHHQQQHQLAAAQLLQAAQMTLGGTGGGGGYLNPQLQAAAAQLLQQAGLAGMPGHVGGAGMMGGRGGLGPGMGGMGGDGMGGGAGSHGGAGRGGDVMRGGGGGRLSRRTTDPVAEAERKAQQEKLYALNSERIYSGQDRRTTLMIKNIPNKYTQKMLLATIDENFHGTYDFFYLPIDFKNKCNVGYAFINMTQPIHIIPLVERFNNKKWDRFNSEKICSISYARIQGRAALISHFQNSSLMHEDKRCRPILFVLEGEEATGEQEAFPPALGGGGGGSASQPSSLPGPGFHHSHNHSGGSSSTQLHHPHGAERMLSAGGTAGGSSLGLRDSLGGGAGAGGAGGGGGGISSHLSPSSTLSNSLSHPNLMSSSSLVSMHESCGISSCGGSSRNLTNK